jgi:glutaminyl-peptide cyclotransferase
MKTQRIALFLLGIFVLGGLGVYVKSCQNDPSTDTKTEALTLKPAASFNADSAVAFTAKQVAFGPRILGTPAHKACASWIVEKMKQYGATVIEQDFEVIEYNGFKKSAKNIIASINPTASKRILLAAHWDTRPIADKDSLNPKKPIDGANDGASGVAALIEIARAIQNSPQKLGVGVDFIFFDAEDNGEPSNYQKNSTDKNIYWCLGSQHWAKNKHKADYTAYYGILLDMVGAKGATFPKEGYSMQYAADINNQVWKVAGALGFGKVFIDQSGNTITDDHQFVNEIARIPMIDIIEITNGDFGKYHHTHNDNMSVIDPSTFKAVGQTVVQMLYQEEL